jgi:PAS domain S-box-containing protein
LERSNAEFQRREVDAQAHATEVSAILEELRGSEERLRLLGDNLPDSMVYQYTHELDGTPRFLYVSAGIERFNGVKAEDVLNDAGVLHRQFLPEELPGLLEAERASARDLSVFEHEMQMRLPDGQIRWMHLHSRPRRLPDGRTVWDGVQTDITERKRAEDAVRESEAKYRHLFNSIEEMVTVYQVERNDQGRIVECRLLDANPAFLRAAAVSSIDEIRGKTSSEVFGRDWSAAHIDAIQQALDTDKTLTQEVHHAELDRDYITTVVPLDANTYLGTGRDVTERKRSEQALLRSEKLASVGRMASTIAHEINNPLETIGHAVYLALTDSETSPKAKSYLELATQELDRVTHITKQTLAFNREDKTPTLIDLRTSVDSVVKLFAPRLKSRGIAVEKRYAEAECIRAGGGEIQQIISNLLSNSMDATPNHGKIMLRVSPSIGRNGSRLVRFTIADTGSGIPPERQKKIFEPFFTTKEIIGTGLGLWVTKQIVDKYGATIRVRSKPKRGTVFSIAFPAAEEIDKHAEGGSAE